MRRLLILALLAAAALLGADAVREEVAGSGATVEGRVLRVVDGDTVHVLLPSGRERVRYLGVDTPESTNEVECHGRAASAANARLVAGRRVRLRFDVERRDRYGRLLAYVHAEGRMVNAALVRGGFAEPLTIEPNVRHERRFRALARDARRAGRGMWRACPGGLGCRVPP